MTFAYLLFIILWQNLSSRKSDALDLLLTSCLDINMSLDSCPDTSYSFRQGSSLSSTSPFSVLPSNPSSLQRSIQESKSSLHVTFIIYHIATNPSTMPCSPWEKVHPSAPPLGGSGVLLSLDHSFCSSYAHLRGCLHTLSALSISTADVHPLPTP